MELQKYREIKFEELLHYLKYLRDDENYILSSIVIDKIIFIIKKDYDL